MLAGSNCAGGEREQGAVVHSHRQHLDWSGSRK